MFRFPLFLFFILPLFINGQANVQGVILDSEDNRPIEFVDIYNENDYTFSNEDGKFIFNSEEDSVTLQVLGYRRLTMALRDLHKNDTIYLDPEVYQLDEVVVGNIPPVINMFKAINKNYPIEPFKESFFLRSVLKKNNEIQELQDIYGIVERQVLLATTQYPRPKKNYRFSVQQMRKAGIKDKKIDIETPGLEYIFDKFVSIYISPERFDFTPKITKDSLATKFFFESKDRDNTTTTGYYLMRNKDSALVEVVIQNPTPDPTGSKKSDFTYQTTYYGMHAFFSKDVLLNRYHIKKARLDLSIDVKFEDGTTDTYKSFFIVAASPFEPEKKIKNNVSQSKDLFELNAPYNDAFWKNQNSLKLSDEMIDFIGKIEESEGKRNFKTISNFD